ncbi:hypothetical protein PanABDRAFT_0035 [Pantoea sp. aB]|nr:hypothetical protein PanABDRAFT_0035 [Pantoea sp. aB]
MRRKEDDVSLHTFTVISNSVTLINSLACPSSLTGRHDPAMSLSGTTEY